MKIYLALVAFFLMAFGLYTLLMAMANIVHFGNIKRKAKLQRDGKLVSVVMAARNEEMNLPRVMDSLLKQSYKNLEILVIDDESTDHTWDILKSYAEKDSRVRIFQSDSSLERAHNGKVNALMQVMPHARGEYLYETDADTEHGVDAVAFAYSVMNSSNLDFITGIPKQRCGSYMASVNISPMMLIMICLPHFFEHFIRIPSLTVAVGQFIMMKKSCYDDVGGYESIKNRVCEDMAIASRFVKMGKKYQFVNISKHVCCYMYSNSRQAFNGISRMIKGTVPMSFASIPIVALIVLLFFHMIAGPVISLIIPLWHQYFLQMALITFGWVSFYLTWFVSSLVCGFQISVALSGPVALFQTVMMYIYSLYMKLTGKNFIWKGRQI